MITVEIIFSMVVVVGVLAGIIVVARILIVVVEAAMVIALLMCNVRFAISLDMELCIVIIDWREITFLPFVEAL